MMWCLLALAFAEDPSVRVSGYLDVGGFATTGDGVSYRRDPAGEITDHPDEVWVFYGDPWAGTVNSRGEPADLGNDRNNLDRVDFIHSAGKPSLLVNTANVSIAAARGPRLAAQLSVDLLPRTGALGAPGDALVVDLAYLDMLPWENANVRLYVGKVSSAFGREYQVRLATERFGITPSLMSRYTVGTPTGVKLRASALDRRLWVTASLTNGGTTTSRFGHFYDELDSNLGKTATARVAGRLRGLAVAELGVSGQVGSVDGQPDASVVGWQAGADASVRVEELEVVAEAMLVRLPADLPDEDFVHAHGGYLETRWTFRPKWGALLRFDWRRAEMRVVDNFYDSNVGRVAVGLRVRPVPELVLKLEYLGIVEFVGRSFPDDVITTSCVYRF
ncbi:MAG: hypothetical protein EP330_15995 [Deltaproteobacteria bacterium]|nr:MAG: hypothetical protein EP330_15995 [Deltaproteobacteria bacterium]